MNFSYNGLKLFLLYAKDFAPIVSMKESVTMEDKCIILRHDIDFDIYPAYEVYKMEKGIDVKSTFFVLVTSYTYNSQADKTRKILIEMVENGFEVGLHFDPSVYGNISQREMQEKIEFECKILENIIGVPIASIALHKPTSYGYHFFDGYINAYSKELFSNEQYLSDSMRADPSVHPFRGKNPYEFVKQAKKYPLQITLHPEQYLKKEGDRVDTIRRYLTKMTADIFYDYVNNIFIIRRKKLWDLK